MLMVPPLSRTTVSPVAGEPAGDQFCALNQLPEAASQVFVAAKTVVAVNRKMAVSRRDNIFEVFMAWIG